MNFFIFSSLINGLSATIFGFFGYSKNRKSFLHKIFGAMNLSVAIWSYCYFLWLLSDQEFQALFWTRAFSLGSILIPIFHLHWVLILLNLQERKKKILLLGYLMTVFFLLFSFTPLFVKEVKPEPPFLYWPKPGILYHFYLIFSYFGLLGYAVLQLLKSFKREVGYKREQIKYLLTGAFVGFFSGATNFPLWYGIHILPYANPLVSLYVLIFTYAIVRHRLMDIRIVARHVTVYGISLITALGFGLAAMFLINRYFPGVIPAAVIGPIVLVLGIIIFEFTKEKFGKFANRWLFYTLYSYEKTLADLAKKLSSFIDLNRLIFLTTDSIKEVMKLDKIALILRSLEIPKKQLKFLTTAFNEKSKPSEPLKIEEQGEFFLAKNIGFQKEIKTLLENRLVIHYLAKSKKSLVSDELEILANEIKEEILKKKFLALKNYMEKMEAALYLPLIIEDQLIGLFVLGKKVSGDAYSVQDLQLLETLANQIAVAINNAQLYKQAQQFNQILKVKIIEATKELTQAYRELKKLDDSKTEFLSLASHQLRTPLSAIKGYLSMTLAGDFGQLQKETKDALKNVYESNERLINLVNDLLNVTKIEAGKLEYHPVKNNFSLLIKGVIEEFKNIAQNKKLKLIYQEEKLPIFSFDPEKIRQVLINLIDNAIKYTEKGSVSIETIISPSLAKTTENEVLVKIKDTGIGISPEKMSSLFQWFSRGKGAMRLESGGFGLGLYIAKKIVERAGGKIWAESEGEGKGTTFFFTLPLDK